MSTFRMFYVKLNVASCLIKAKTLVYEPLKWHDYGKLFIAEKIVVMIISAFMSR